MCLQRYCRFPVTFPWQVETINQDYDWAIVVEMIDRRKFRDLLLMLLGGSTVYFDACGNLER